MSKTADLIIRLRKGGLSQSEISRRTGIPQPRLSRWENAAEPSSTDDVLMLAELERDLAAGRPCIDVARPVDVRDAA